MCGDLRLQERSDRGGAEHRAQLPGGVDQACGGAGDAWLDVMHRDALQWSKRHAQAEAGDDQPGDKLPPAVVESRRPQHQTDAAGPQDESGDEGILAARTGRPASGEGRAGHRGQRHRARIRPACSPLSDSTD